MAYSALVSVKAAEAEAEKMVAQAHRDAAKLIRDSSEQSKEIINKVQAEATVTASEYRQSLRQQAELEAERIRAEAVANVQQIKVVDNERREQLLRFVAEGIVKRYVLGSNG